MFTLILFFIIIKNIEIIKTFSDIFIFLTLTPTFLIVIFYDIVFAINLYQIINIKVLGVLNGF